jgi:hypothetical protein
MNLAKVKTALLKKSSRIQETIYTKSFVRFGRVTRPPKGPGVIVYSSTILTAGKPAASRASLMCSRNIDV